MHDLFKYPVNITRAELLASSMAESIGIDNTPANEIVEANLCSLAHVLQGIRDVSTAKLGRETPLTITSGFRCDDLNKAVGGVVNSAHTLGLSADFRVSGYTVAETVALIRERMPYLGFHKVIDEFGRWVHITAPVSKGGEQSRQFLRARKRNGRTMYELM